MTLTSRHPKPIAQMNLKSPITEAYRTVRTNIQFASIVDNVQAIIMTSAVPSEGKTSTACNVAVVSAQAGKRVLLIDADMRKPQIHQRFQISNLQGLSSLIIKEDSVENTIVKSETPGLFLLPCGPIPPNPSEMLASNSFMELIKQFREEYDLIIVDTPPVLSVTDALVATRAVDGTVYVIDASHTNRALAKKAVTALNQVGAKILGVVLNRMKMPSGSSYYYYNYYTSNEQATV